MRSSADLVGPPDADIQSIARIWNYDAYAGALLAPRAAQPTLIALAAFSGDLVRIVTTVSEPTLALIRLTWWRDELERIAAEGNADHPLGVALAPLLRADGRLPLMLCQIEAAAAPLEGGEIADTQALVSYAGKRWVAPLRLAGMTLRATPDSANTTADAGSEKSRAPSADLLASAGLAYGAAWLSAAPEPVRDALGVHLSVSILAEAGANALSAARTAWPMADRETRRAALAASLAPLYRAGTDPGPLRKLVRLLRVRLTGRL